MIAEPAVAGVDARAVANFFLKRAAAENRSLVQSEVQWLACLAQCRHLADMGRPLVTERLAAGPEGPVFPSIHAEFKHYRQSPIIHEAFDSDDFETEREIDLHGDGWSDAQYHAARLAMETVWRRYGGIDGTQEVRQAYRSAFRSALPARPCNEPMLAFLRDFDDSEERAAAKRIQSMKKIDKARLKQLAAANPPPASWYEEDFGESA